MKLSWEYLDRLVWGNPSQEDVYNMRHENYLDELLPPLLRKKPPTNSSRITMQELNQLQDYTQNGELSSRKDIFDKELVPFFNDLFIRNGCDPEDVQKTTRDLVGDVLPVITKLKYEFNRPRPNQLAYYHDLAFFPKFSRYVSSPSYPSGHTVLCTVIAEVLAHHYSPSFPDCFDVVKRLAGEVMESRLYMGVHYPSDNLFGMEVANAIIKNKTFRQKYDF